VIMVQMLPADEAKPDTEGWYPVLVCWDEAEGFFPEAALWEGRWQAPGPVAQFWVVRFGDKDAAYEFAREHDPEW